MADVIEKNFVAGRQPAIDAVGTSRHRGCHAGAVNPLRGHRACSAARSILLVVDERQFVDEPDEARVLVGRRVGERETLDLLVARRAAGLRR